MRTALTMLFALAAAACTAGPDYRPPETTLAPRFLEAGTGSGMPHAADWWRTLGDPTLDGLIRDAVADGFDLRIALARVDEVRALYSLAGAARYPEVDAVASATRNRDSENTEFAMPGASDYSRLELGAAASWEIDLWGRVRRQVEAAEADLGAADALFADARRAVVARVAAEYVEIRGAERELLVARRNLEAQLRTVELVETLAEEGLGQAADVARARGLLRETESVVPLLEGRIAGGAHRLAVLTGGDAAEIRARLSAASTLPDAPADLDPGVPSDLLLARPDVRAAERELAAATARIGVAVADLFPRVTLFGRFGLDSSQASTLFDADSVSFGVGPAVRWPLLDFGRVRARIEAEGARQAAALARYEEVVARAVMEVETALAALRARTENRAILEEALAANAESLRIIDARFREGGTSFLDVLDAQRRVLAVEAELARARTQLLLNYVALSTALG